MIVNWEASDVIFGRHVTKKGLSYYWLLGYSYLDPNTSDKQICLIDSRDGLINLIGYNKNDAAFHLSVNGFLPTEIFLD